MPRAAELGLRPSLAVPLFERDGQDAPIGDSLSRPLQDVDELLSNPKINGEWAGEAPGVAKRSRDRVLMG